MLWQHVLGVGRSWLVAHDTDTLDASDVERFHQLAKQRLEGEPMAYIVGRREFMGHAFQVTPDVLIPRPETELLVEMAVQRMRRPRLRSNTGGGPFTSANDTAGTLRVLDLGTGSGAIAVSIALACPHVHVVATDISEAALQVAQRNASALGAKVEFFCGSWYHALPSGMDFDVIVSNPPYIPSSDSHLQQGDLRFEPLSALTDGADGLGALRAIVMDSSSYLRAGGCLFVEHGWDQAGAVRQLMQHANYTRVDSMPDLAGIARITGGYLATSILE